ncbi:MAG TPA: ABC transporter permease [Thermoanaerobaculia bacterium]|nr:ABC transporter permease [Thermoanaerobaculia bacterium]
MRTFFGFVRKEFFHLGRDRRTLVVLFGIPLMQMLLFGFALRNEVKDTPVAVVDLSGDPLTRRLASALEASESFRLAATVRNLDEGKKLLAESKAKVLVVFAEDFSEHFGRDGRAEVEILTDGSDPNSARTRVAYANGVVQQELAAVARESGKGAGAPHIEAATRMRFNPSLESTYLFVPGVMALVLTLVSALMTSVTITREKELGTMEVLLVSPLRPFQIIVGKVVPYLGLSFLNVLIILGLSRFAFGVPIVGNVFLLIAESVLYIVCALSLGVLVSTRAETQQAATTGSLSGLMFPTMLLSGFIFPLESMPRVLYWLSHIVPARWFLVIVRGIMLKGVGIAELWPQTLILAAMTTFFLLASVRNFHIRLE